MQKSSKLFRRAAQFCLLRHTRSTSCFTGYVWTAVQSTTEIVMPQRTSWTKDCDCWRNEHMVGRDMPEPIRSGRPCKTSHRAGYGQRTENPPALAVGSVKSYLFLIMFLFFLYRFLINSEFTLSTVCSFLIRSIPGFYLIHIWSIPISYWFFIRFIPNLYFILIWTHRAKNGLIDLYPFLIYSIFDSYFVLIRFISKRSNG